MQTKLLRQAGPAPRPRETLAAECRRQVLWFYDDDMIVGKDHVELHLATRAAYGEAMIGGTRWYSPASLAALEATPFGRFRVELERRFSTSLAERRLNGSCVETVTLSACDLSIGREALAGWRFDESFPFAGAEDQDLSTRAARAGLPLIRNYDIKALHADPRTTLRQFCEREERGAHTVVALGRKSLEHLGDFRDNEPIASDDRPALDAKKLAKSLLSRPRLLAMLHCLVDWLERAGLSERALWRAYRVVVGLHIFRGYRQALRSVDAFSIRAS